MRSNKLLFIRIIAITIMIALVLSGCGTKQAAAPTVPVESTSSIEATQTVPPAAENESTAQEAESTAQKTQSDLSGVESISVAIYPHLPDKNLFMRVLSEQWAQLEPNIELEFVSWDCYSEGAPEDIDVVMFDAVFTSYLAEGGYIQPIDRSMIQDADGIIPVAMDGITYNDEVYGIPYLLCSYFLVQYTDDEAVSAVDNFEDLYEIVAVRMKDSEKYGLLTNFSTNYESMYLDTLMDVENQYSEFQETPDTTIPNEEALNILRKIVSMREDCNDWGGATSAFSYASHFNDGHGSVYFGFSEAMAFMDDILDDITIRNISYSRNGNIPLYYTDIAAMGAHVSNPDKQAACLKLMNLVASEEFLLEACVGTEEAQYLLPARESVYILGAQTYPMYEQLRELAIDENNRICRFNPDIWDFFEEASKNLDPWS